MERKSGHDKAMVGYRRNFVRGGTYFFTVVLQDRTSSYLIDYNDQLLQSIQTVKNKTHFSEIAFVIMPDHLHTIWKLPENDHDFPGRWRAIKSLFTRTLVKSGVPLVKNSRGEYLLWQKRYWEHTLSNSEDLQSHIDYIHYNPVKHGYVNDVSDWAHSSFHRYVDKGLLPENWGSGVNIKQSVDYGE